MPAPAILLSKAARRVYFAAHPEEIPAADPATDPPGASPSLETGYIDVGTTYMHLQLQHGGRFYRRFSRSEAELLWAAYARVDRALQSEARPQLDSPSGRATPPPFGGLQWSPGFQGGPTTYMFHNLPPSSEEDAGNVDGKL
eukprot:SAG22_NODE_8621_length_641_cov_0.726937_1_plen_141_part_01